jgi:hypothetical protein
MTLQKWESIDGIGFFQSERKWSIEVATIRIDDPMKKNTYVGNANVNGACLRGNRLVAAKRAPC